MNNTFIDVYNNNDINIYNNSLLVIFIFITSGILAVICVMSFLFYSFYYI